MRRGMCLCCRPLRNLRRKHCVSSSIKSGYSSGKLSGYRDRRLEMKNEKPGRWSVMQSSQADARYKVLHTP